jgi:GAF domain-containing protein
MAERDSLSARAALARSITAAVLRPGADTAKLDALVASAIDSTKASAAHLSMLVDRQITASVSGAMLSAMHRGEERSFEDAFCATTLRLGEPLAIVDATEDQRVSSMPAVTEGGVRSYLGAPLVSRTTGETVGVLCVVGTTTREWSREDVSELTSIAAEVMAELNKLEASQQN